MAAAFAAAAAATAPIPAPVGAFPPPSDAVLASNDAKTDAGTSCPASAMVRVWAGEDVRAVQGGQVRDVDAFKDQDFLFKCISCCYAPWAVLRTKNPIVQSAKSMQELLRPACLLLPTDSQDETMAISNEPIYPVLGMSLFIHTHEDVVSPRSQAPHATMR